MSINFDDYDDNGFNPIKWSRDKLDAETIKAQQSGDEAWGDDVPLGSGMSKADLRKFGLDEPIDIRQYAPDPHADRPSTYLNDISDWGDADFGDFEADIQHRSRIDYEAHQRTQALSVGLWRSIRGYLAWAAFGALAGWVLWLFVTEGTK